MAVIAVAVVIARGAWPDAPSAAPQVAKQGTQTFYLKLSGQRFSSITVSSTEAGNSSVAYALEVNSLVPVYIENMLVDGLVCKTVTWDDIEVGQLNLINNVADGNSFNFITTSTPSVIVSPGSGAQTISATGDQYDRIEIDGDTQGGYIKTLDLTNIQANGAPCRFGRLRIGTLTFTNATVGSGNGVTIADLIFTSNVKVGSVLSSGNSEQNVSVK